MQGHADTPPTAKPPFRDNTKNKHSDASVAQNVRGKTGAAQARTLGAALLALGVVATTMFAFGPEPTGRRGLKSGGRAHSASVPSKAAAVVVDCNANTIPDECDIHCGAPGGVCDVLNCGQSLDCNENDVPDECEIAADATMDCDGDGLLSKCEFITSERDCDSNGICNGVEITTCSVDDPSCADCNGNQIPDACDIGFGGGFPAEINPANLDGTDGFVISGLVSGDKSGHSVSLAGDLNNDGIDDVIIGAPGRSKSYVVFGAATVGVGGVFNLSALDGANGFVINGAGGSVSSAGDVNNDGTDDLIIGAPFADPNGQASGECYVVFGGTGVGSGGVLNLSELDGSNGFVIPGIRSFDFLGRSVSSAGDVNDDGIDDFVIGAPGRRAIRSHIGRSYLLFGGETIGNGGVLNLAELDGTNGFVINGYGFGDQFGFDVSPAGDVNNDGIDDFIIGSPGQPGSDDVGRSYVVFGGEALGNRGVLSVLGDGTNLFVIIGTDAADRSGGSVSLAGDVNNDGIDDLIIGANGAGQNFVGASYVLFGGGTIGSGGVVNLSDLDGTNGFIIPGIDPGDNSGSTVSSAGDVNNDGIDDLAIGAFDADPNNLPSAGESYVVFGGVDVGSGGVFNLSELGGTNGVVINGNGSFDNSARVSSAGDVNNDGIDDLIIGAPFAEPNNQDNAGESYLVFGRRFSSDCNGNAIPDGCDISSGIAADCNENQILDECDIVSGESMDCNVNGVPDRCDIAECQGELDCSDCNQNDIPDGCDAVMPLPHPTNLSDLNGTNGFVIPGIDAGDPLGTSVSSAGDVNKDGINDLIIGAPSLQGSCFAALATSESYVVFGGSGLGSSGMLDLTVLNGSNGFVIIGIDAGDQFLESVSVSSAGDVNNDGTDDLIIGAERTHSCIGASYVIFGSVGVGRGAWGRSEPCRARWYERLRNLWDSRLRPLGP